MPIETTETPRDMPGDTPATVEMLRAVAAETTSVIARNAACENLNDATGLMQLLIGHLQRAAGLFESAGEEGAHTAVTALRDGLDKVWNKGVGGVNRSLATAPPDPAVGPPA